MQLLGDWTSFGWSDLAGFLAKMAVAVGLGVWAVILLAPTAALPPATFERHASEKQDLGAVADWFGGQALRVAVSATGVMATDDGRGSALLSINGARPKGFRVGERLAPGVTLHSVYATHVLIDQDGRIEEVQIPESPSSRINGFRLV